METDAEKTVFISYRRAVSAGWARAIYGNLVAHGYDVFMDVESIDSGTFETIILNQIAARAHFLILLTPGSVERCAEPGDWLRREIEHAIALERNVVPLLLHGFEFSQHTKYLTGQLSQLSSYNGLTVPHDYFDAAMEKLRTRFLKQPVRGAVRPTPAGQQAEVRRKMEKAASQPAPSEAQLTAEQWFERGRRAYDNNDFEQALAHFTEAIRLNPQFGVAYGNRGNVRGLQGDMRGALADFDQAVRLNPQEAIVYDNRGLARHLQGDMRGALADFNEAIRLDPQYAIAYNNRGAARYGQGDLAGALADFDQAIQLDPQFAIAYYRRGAALADRGDVRGALADFNEAIRLDPNYPDTYNGRSLIRYSQGDLAGSIADLGQAIRLDPQFVDAYHNRGYAREAQGDLAGAIADFQKYLNLGGGRESGDRAKIERTIRKLKRKLK